MVRKNGETATKLPLNISTGSPSSGTYKGNMSNADSVCYEYWFEMVSSTAGGAPIQLRYPPSGVLITYGNTGCSTPTTEVVKSSLVPPREQMLGVAGSPGSGNQVGAAVGLAILTVMVISGLFFGRKLVFAVAEKLAGNEKIRAIAAGLDFLSFILIAAAAGTPKWTSSTITGTTQTFGAGPFKWCGSDGECESILNNCAVDGCRDESLIHAVRVFLVVGILICLAAGVINVLIYMGKIDKGASKATLTPAILSFTAGVFGLFSVCLWSAYTTDVLSYDSTTTGLETGITIAGIAWLFPMASSFLSYSDFRGCSTQTAPSKPPSKPPGGPISM